ncbi:protein kinase [Streptomyces sp. DSM 44917]|uniref:non-specific serine/threonine protein kinase n=1 Tax=Streptomyces boetiae TaxID=3075541 RepID=A0ABU2L2I6_9ACTN|nr:protein kinase [Streptomyces sp. DSM 44917]MDT0305776.1 protein kinase [Streptomyces sp. DSM 44917]
MTDGPYELTDAIRHLLAPTAARLVMNRRGSTVWKVTGEHGRHAVKLGYPAAVTHQYTALAPAREAAILRLLGREGVHAGEWERGTWSVQPWYEGESLWERWEPHRSGTARCDLDVDALRSAQALAALHAAGWVHGDVQPHHFLFGPDGVRLIDLGLARGGEVPAAYDFPHRGCLVHYESPEISRGVLETGTALPTPASDVFGLGASLFMSATGLRAIDFPPEAERPEQRRVIARGRHRDVDVPGRLGPLVGAMLSPDPADRPSINEVCAGLGWRDPA